MDSVTFSHPEPRVARSRVLPVFLPFAGCPFRCLFCAQDRQTGQGDAHLETVAETLERDLRQRLESGSGPVELAFYGGTFTFLPDDLPMRLVRLGQRYRDLGLVTRIRCSTRPDSVDPAQLEELAEAGLDMVELGIQSFDDASLAASGRGYTGEVARKGCETVKASGLAFGIQLLPGLPGDRPGLFQEDVRIGASMKPETVRLYPCLVFRNTPLAALYEQGKYRPWSLERTKQELGQALPVFWEHGVVVSRIGLSREASMEGEIIAGPEHPALGQSVRGHALLEVVRSQCETLGRPPVRLDVPRRYQGELMGHGRELAGIYETLGLGRSSIRYVEGSDFTLT